MFLTPERTPLYKPKTFAYSKRSDNRVDVDMAFMKRTNNVSFCWNGRFREEGLRLLPVRIE